MLEFSQTETEHAALVALANAARPSKPVAGARSLSEPPSRNSAPGKKKRRIAHVRAFSLNAAQWDEIFSEGDPAPAKAETPSTGTEMKREEDSQRLDEGGERSPNAE